MPIVTSRRAMLLAVTIATILLMGGCGGRAAKSSAAAPSTAPATTAAPTTTAPWLTAKERAWLTAVDKLGSKAEKAFTGPTSEFITRAKLQSHASTLRGYSRQLRRLGLPGGRLQPVSALLKKTRKQFDKGAACYITAAGVVSPGGAVLAGPDERTFNRAIDCAGAGEGNGLNYLFDAAAKGKEISAELS
ncbi:MAG TPA: hypothetical protein VE776_12320 [Actinomycetota bacterium]|jgi:hypothetical protein|nr:hypothetical protein [Actinomycetota bacterium]